MTLQLFGFGLALIENMRKYCKSYSQIFCLRPTELLSKQNKHGLLMFIEISEETYHARSKIQSHPRPL